VFLGPPESQLNLSIPSNKEKKILLIWWAILFVKLTLAFTLPLSLDESYYWVWSKNLQLSYFDHPPMVAWLLWIGNIFENIGYGVRVPHVLLGHLTLLVWIHILKQFLSFEKIQDWLFLVIACPLLGVGSLLATPDVPLLFFWTIALYFALKILQDPQKKLLNYFLFGSSLGLGFLSKYHIVLFVPALLLTLLFDQNYKKISIKGALFVLVGGLLFSSPVLIWNFQNEFKSFLFQIDHGFGQKTWDPFWTYSFLLGQAFIIFPTVLYAAIRFGFHSKLSLFFFLSWFPFLFFFVSSFRGPVEPNWPVAALFSVFFFSVLSSTKKVFLQLGTVFWGVLSLLLIIQAYSPIFSFLPEKSNELRYFNPIEPFVEQYRPLYFGSYQMASSIWYKTKVPQKKLFQINRYDFFDELSSEKPSEKIFYVIKELWVPYPDWLSEKNYLVQKIQDIGEKFELVRIEEK